jgi:hydrogenase large subunit
MSFGCFDRYAELGTLYVNPLVTAGDHIAPLHPDEITESIDSSWYTAEKNVYTPFELLAKPDMRKSGAYSWVKAPRYRGVPYEVGPLARMWLCGDYRNGISAMDRTLARVLETKKIADIIEILLDQLQLDVVTQEIYDLPRRAQGMGLIDTTRGALGHWLKIENSVISFYQIITPSAWNLSTRCLHDMAGPAEKALIGTAVANEENPVELGRIIRTFDPCVSCATHVYRRGKPVITTMAIP